MANQELRSKITVQGGDQGAKEIEKISAATEKLGKATRQTSLVTAKAEEESGKSALTSSSAAGAAGALAVGITKVVLAMRATVTVLKAIPAAGAVVQGILSVVGALKDEVAERLRLVRVMKLQGAAQDELLTKQRDNQQTLEDVSDRRRFGGFDAATASRVAGQTQQAQNAFPFLNQSNLNTVFGTFGGGDLSQEELTDLTILQQAGKLDFEPEQFRSQRSSDAFGKRVLRRRRSQAAIDQIAERETIQGQEGGTGKRRFRKGLTQFEAEVRGEAASEQGPSGQLKSFLEDLQTGGKIAPDVDLDTVQKLIRAFENSEELRNANLARTGLNPDVDVPISAFNNLGVRPSVDIATLDPGGVISDIFKGLGIGPSQNVDARDFESALQILRRIERFGTSGDVIINNFNNQGQRIVTPSGRTQQKTITNGENATRDRELVGF